MAFWYISQWICVVRFIRRYWTSTSRPDTISLGRRQGIGDRRPHRSANHSSEAIVPLSWGTIDETITRRAGYRDPQTYLVGHPDAGPGGVRRPGFGGGPQQRRTVRRLPRRRQHQGRHEQRRPRAGGRSDDLHPRIQRQYGPAHHRRHVHPARLHRGEWSAERWWSGPAGHNYVVYGVAPTPLGTDPSRADHGAPSRRRARAPSRPRAPSRRRARAPSPTPEHRADAEPSQTQQSHRASRQTVRRLPGHHAAFSALGHVAVL